MTDTAAAWRPSPRPRPGVQRPADPPHLRVVPDSSEVPTSGTPEGAPSETITAGQSGSPAVETSPTSDLGFRTRAANLYTASRTYWTPPAVFTDQPASLAELADYARHAPWTSQNAGVMRAFGVWWYRLAGYPATVTGRYAEWVWQRPGRFLLTAGVVKLVALTGPGSWAVDHIVYPAAHLAGRIFL